MEKKKVPKLRQEVKVEIDIITSDDIKIYYTGKFQDFTSRYIINFVLPSSELSSDDRLSSLSSSLLSSSSSVAAFPASV